MRTREGESKVNDTEKVTKAGNRNQLEALVDGFYEKDLRERENDVKRGVDAFFRKIIAFPCLARTERYGSETFSNPRRTNPECFQSRVNCKPSHCTLAEIHGAVEE
jgi:ATP-dependent exoDNAse (exonuclease V) alpha subunit